MGIDIPVIWTVRNDKDEVGSLHFDTRQYRHIIWDNPEDLRKQLLARIEANIPRSPSK